MSVIRKFASPATNSKRIIKRPQNPFFVFSNVKGKELKSQNPGSKQSEISKILGQLWKGLSEEEKRPYVEMARDLREDHKRANPDYRFIPRELSLAKKKRENERQLKTIYRQKFTEKRNAQKIERMKRKAQNQNQNNRNSEQLLRYRRQTRENIEYEEDFEPLPYEDNGNDYQYYFNGEYNEVVIDDNNEDETEDPNEADIESNASDEDVE